MSVVSAIAHDQAGTADKVSLAAQNECRHWMESRLSRPGVVGPTTSANELSNLRANVGKASHFTIFVEVRHSSTATSVDKILGKTCVPYPETTTFHGKYLSARFIAGSMTDCLPRFEGNGHCGYQPSMD